MLHTQDLETYVKADHDHTSDVRGWIRTRRRMVQRFWLDRETIRRPRIFCQNSGACGSTFVVRLLQENGHKRVFHEKTPDLYQLGLDHYESRLPSSRLIHVLRYTRHDVEFEANNRLFSMTRELELAFPNARLIHLHRDGTEAVRSAMSKPDVKSYLDTHARFHGTLAGPHDADPFTRFCHHWANMNQRILDDFSVIDSERFDLRFEDLISGNVSVLEDLLGKKLGSPCQPANVGRVRASGKFPSYAEWNPEQKAIFQQICGPVMSQLGR